MSSETSTQLAHDEGYELRVGRWSRLAARAFVDALALPPGLAWLDIGTGTGALAHTIADNLKMGTVS